MKRKEFIQKSSLASLALAILPNLVFGKEELDIISFIDSIPVPANYKISNPIVLLNEKFYKNFITKNVAKWYNKSFDYKDEKLIGEGKLKCFYIQKGAFDQENLRNNQYHIELIKDIFKEADILTKKGYMSHCVMSKLSVVKFQDNSVAYFIFAPFSNKYYSELLESRQKGISYKDFSRNILI